MKAAEVFESVTSKLLESMRDAANHGTAWEMPWHALASAGIPRNFSTRRAYQGGNVIALWVEAMIAGYEEPYWATYKQWAELGAQVRKGEHGVGLIKWSVIPDKKKPAKADGSRSTAMVPNAFTVFNIAQVDEVTPEARERLSPTFVALSEHERLLEADLFFTHTGAKVEFGGDRAYYNTVRDYIQMPEYTLFKSLPGFYSTLAHEHGHWTGHESRLNRSFAKTRGDAAYAFEELVAEITAAFVMAHLGVASEPRADHAQYLNSWIEVLAHDEKAFFAAASKANEAFNFLVKLSAPVEETEEAAA